MPCRSIVPNGAAWAPSAGASPRATARSAACRSNRKPTNTAISNIICPMSATDCRSPVRGLGHEHDPEKHALGLRPDGLEPVFPRDKRGTRLRGDHARKKKQSHANVSHFVVVSVADCQCNFGFGGRLGI